MNTLGIKNFDGSFYKDQLPTIKKGHWCIINLDDSYSGRVGHIGHASTTWELKNIILIVMDYHHPNR